MDKIEQFLISLPDQKRVWALELRELILLVDDRISESIKWNNLTFSVEKKSFAFIYTLSQLNYINLGFFYATLLKDPKKLFEGTGKTMRHIKVASSKDIPKAQIKKWVKETIILKGK